MKIVVGLGNPGREYAATRHNLGFMVVDELSRRFGKNERRTRFRAEIAEIFVDGEKVILVKPQTYMNLSGAAVREVVSWYKLPPDDLLVILDEIDLPFGVTRMRAKGGSGGHNGLNSIIADLGTEDFARLRIGIGRGHGQAVRQVLTRFNQDEERELPGVVSRAVDCTLDWLRNGVIAAMNRCNRLPEPPEPVVTSARITPGK